MTVSSITRPIDMVGSVIDVIDSTPNVLGESIIWDEKTQSGVLKLEKFPQAAAGKDYQLWIIDPNKKTPVSAGVVPVGQNGSAHVPFKPADRVDAAQKFAISIERAGGAPAPTAGQIIELGN